LELDSALVIVPKLYQLMQQSPGAMQLRDPFAEIAALLQPASRAA
jgi:hypothetical protein